MGRGALLCLAGAKSASGKRLRSFNRIRDSLPLCRLSHATGQTNGSFRVSSESDSQNWKTLTNPGRYRVTFSEPWYKAVPLGRARSITFDNSLTFLLTHRHHQDLRRII